MLTKIFTLLLSILALAVSPAKVAEITPDTVTCVTGDGQAWGYHADSPDLHEGETVLLVFVGEEIVAVF